MRRAAKTQRHQEIYSMESPFCHSNQLFICILKAPLCVLKGVRRQAPLCVFVSWWRILISLRVLRVFAVNRVYWNRLVPMHRIPEHFP